MAYRKTEKVLAGIETRKAAIVEAAILLIGKHGMDGLTTDAIATKAKVSVGLLYKYFPDMVELRAAVFAHLAASDLKVLRDAGGLEKGIRAWAKHVALDYRLISSVGALPGYREPIRAELAKQIRAAGGEGTAVMSALVYGAVLEAAGTMKPRDELTLVNALLRAVGVRAKATA
jgi:AcrR family transcriptional regulator